MYIIYNKAKIFRKSCHGNPTNFEIGELCFTSGTQPDTEETLIKLKENFSVGAKYENLRIASEVIRVTDKDKILNICKSSRIVVNNKTKKIEFLD